MHYVLFRFTYLKTINMTMLNIFPFASFFIQKRNLFVLDKNATKENELYNSLFQLEWNLNFCIHMKIPHYVVSSAFHKSKNFSFFESEQQWWPWDIRALFMLDLVYLWSKLFGTRLKVLILNWIFILIRIDIEKIYS